MSRLKDWWTAREQKMFYWANRKMRHHRLQAFFSLYTHLGGATFTISISLILAMWAPDPYKRIAFYSMIALATSHIPVALIKRIYPRIRPHLALPEALTGRKPLMDHSFPSGHSTAAFAVSTPWLLAAPALFWPLFIVASGVAFSRVYLGLHYPSDCLVGICIGTLAGVLTTYFVL